MIPIRLLGPKVLVALEPKATEVEASTGMHYHEKGQTEGGIILAQPTDMYDADEHSRGLVVALGAKAGTVSLDAVKTILQQAEDFTSAFKKLDRLTPAPFEMALGDVVLFPPSAGVTLGEHEDGITYVILHEQDVIAVIEPKSEAAA